MHEAEYLQLAIQGLRFLTAACLLANEVLHRRRPRTRRRRQGCESGRRGWRTIHGEETEASEGNGKEGRRDDLGAARISSSRPRQVSRCASGCEHVD